MTQVHLWAPDNVYVDEWEDKLIGCLNDLADTFETSPLKTHIRQPTFNAEQLAQVLDEAIFIPVVRQLHIILLTDFDVVPDDHLRLIDHLLLIDAVARSTRRIHVLVFDMINSRSVVQKSPLILLKEGIKTITSVPNSKTQSVDTEWWAHHESFQNCTNCRILIKESLKSILTAHTINEPP